MRLKGVRVGFALTGSHCTLDEIFTEVVTLKNEGAEVTPIISQSVDQTVSRFGSPEKWKSELNRITGRKVINSFVGAEPVGPQKLFDVLVIAPCTGNTLAKLAGAITDTPVLMAAKAHLRNQSPIILAISTNDGLGLNAKNIGVLLNTKNIYMVPFGQDSPTGKPNSLKADMSLIVDTILHSLEGKQVQPVIISYR
ncbi:MAG: dipicolinate synthase subunit B [Actinobacteria bacterium]|nr:dipicolinate synthase subunit B [Actinomycetota bacterium]